MRQEGYRHMFTLGSDKVRFIREDDSEDDEEAELEAKTEAARKKHEAELVAKAKAEAAADAEARRSAVCKNGTAYDVDSSVLAFPYAQFAALGVQRQLTL
ncbi:hypothetical protein LY78DRAFT_660388 [Colletotrichum sublineola]|nr:hypothetical protein LY78DRAFT_660388 [Colletotrichum sublineola]